MIRRVMTEYGPVIGVPAADPRITAYKGVPFAEKPIGENRWRAPHPCQKWTEPIYAADFSPIPMQATPAVGTDIYVREWSVDKEQPMSEDCLYLNVWACADGRKDMPVFVWFFGGGLQVGSTAEMEFDGERIARRGIVVVSVNYRVNAFGFFYHKTLGEESPENGSNFGFQDQQFALEWVHRNIAAFGGDPANVTIGGQSAGGMSVCAQLCNSKNEGLFQRAIIESGSFAPPYPFHFGLYSEIEDAEKQGEDFLKRLNVTSVAEARKIDARTVENESLKLPWACWGQVPDGKFCRENAQRWFTLKDRIHCPVLMGSTSTEFTALPDVGDLDKGDPEALLTAFAEQTYGDKAQEFLSFFTKPITKDSIVRDGLIRSIDYANRLAAEYDETSPYYIYDFDAFIPGWDNPGTFHSVDLWFFFETLAKCWRPFDGRHYDLARQMCDYWCNFIKTGNPNGKDINENDLPEWKPYTKKTPNKMRFAWSPEPKVDPEKPIERFLMDKYEAEHPLR